MKFILRTFAIALSGVLCVSVYAQNSENAAERTPSAPSTQPKKALLIEGAKTESVASSVAPAKKAKKRARRDIPWVSLAHQRELRDIADGVEKPKLADKPAKEQSKEMNYLSRLAQNAAPELSADKFEYANDASGLLTATGNSVIADKNFEIRADKIDFSQKKNYANAFGDVQVSTADSRITSENIRLNFKDDDMKTGYIRFGSSPVFVESKSLDGSRKKVQMSDSVVYFGEPSWVSMNATASSISYDKEEDLLEMEDATLRIGEVPFMYVPYYSQHGLERPPFNINTSAGYNGDYGVYVRNDFYYNGLGDVSAGVLADYYTKRSVLFGPAVAYDTELASSVLSGWAKGAYINDHGDASVRGVDSLGNPIGKDRFFGEFRHKQMISDRVGITGNVSWWSDEFVTRDFRPNLYYDNQVPDNFGEAMYYGDAFTASVFTRFAPNNWEIVQQRLPEVRADMQPLEILNTGAYQTGFVSYAYMREFDPLLTANYLYTNRADAYYGISRPIELSSWSKFTPIIGGRATYYANGLQNGKSDYARFLGQIGFDTQMDIWGTWDYESKTMDIDGLRHHMIPLISYRYIPKAEQGNSYITRIDEDYLTTYPPILDLGTLRNVDEIYNTNTMRFGVQNVFETRDAEYGSREIARLDLYQDVNFDKRYLAQAGDEKQSYSDFYINASVSPARWVTVGTYSRVNFDRMGIPETDNYIRLYDGDAATLYLISTYLDGSITQYSALAEYRISERYKVFGRWSYDHRIEMLTNQTYGLWTRMGNSWVVEYMITQRSGASRQNNFSFGVRVSMMIF